MPKLKSEDVGMLPGTVPVYDITCKDVVMGRGSGTQNHCGNVTYRKLVFLNKELYATSSKFDKKKISKAIVAATREFGGRFLQVDEARGGAHFDIGDKPAWSKTSQALREGQKEIREKLAQENGGANLDEYKQIISEQTFFSFSCRMLDSLYTNNVHGVVTACGANCQAAKRRKELQSLGADPSRIQQAMETMETFSPTMPPPLPQQNNNFTFPQPLPPALKPPPQQYDQNSNFFPPPNNSCPAGPSAALQSMGNMLEETPGVAAEKAPGAEAVLDSLEPLNYKLDHGLPQPNMMKNLISTRSGSVFSLRNICSEDFEMSSEEGKALMEQLNMEVDELLKRKSVGLIEIDSKYAFEDLVFEEDSVDFDNNDDDDLPKRELSADLSLMNMSILTIDDDAKPPPESLNGNPKSALRKKPAFPMRASWRQQQQQPQTRVSFANSLMSLDNESFRNLVVYLGEAEKDVSDVTPTSDRSSSRKMGFPIKKSVVNDYEQGMPTVVGQKSTNTPEEKVSNLTIDEEGEDKGEDDFSRLAGEVATNSVGVPLSGRSLKLSMAGVSDMNMSIASDIGEEEFPRNAEK
mmetsp:Transcript_16935/g.23898  ORF Transcript_16935/g.23898 Transcript_16935/m.23898 type:complete len:578 (-) Transcript_16935:94-1827(-)